MDQLTLNPVTLMYHEVRAPLGLLATAARAVAEDCQDDSLRHQCQTLLRAAERVLRVSNEVLNLAASAENLACVPFFPDDVVRALTEDLGALGLRVTLAQESSGSRCETAVPAGQLEAVLHSLVMNASDHSAPGAEILITTRMEAGMFGITISNAAALPRHRGLGVGMYLCNQLATGFGGDIEAISEGSHYRVKLRVPAWISASVSQDVTNPAN